MTADVRPFTIEVAQEAIDDLRARLRGARWPEAETVDDWSQGTPLRYLRDLATTWAEDYDWRRCERALNSHPQVTTTIDGLEVHAQHIRSPHLDATPLLMVHGWPGSIVEFQKVIGPLTDPTAHGGDAADAFHLVLPSLPGYGWSAKPKRAGTGVGAIARTFDELMVRLGHDSYVAQGGDWGAAVVSAIGSQALGHCTAIHTNMPLAVPSPELLETATDEEKAILATLDHFDSVESAYARQQATRPQTIGYALVDSPVALLGWIIEKFRGWSGATVEPDSLFDRTELLDNVSVYWFTASGASAARLYWESFTRMSHDEVTVPAACSIFPGEVIRCARRWAEQRYTALGYWNEVNRGGHFAAFEVPELFVSEVRAGFAELLR